MNLTLAPIGRELLDDPQADPATVRSALQQIAQSNRWFGGTAAARAGLRMALEGRPAGAYSLLDIGTGAGDLPHDLARWAGRRGVRLTTFGVDQHPAAGTLAAATGLPIALGCAGDLPFATGGADFVLLSQLLHHLAPDSATAVLREAARVARRAVIVADLRRSTVAALAFRVGGALLRFDRVTIDDGVVSLARGYNRHRLAERFAAAGLSARITTLPFARIVGVAQTDA